MKKVLTTVLVMVLVFVFVQFARAQETAAKAKETGKTAQKPGALMVEAVSAKATVDAVDAEKRTVTLKSADGMMRTFKLGPEVVNFDQIKVGDQVKAKYVESVAVLVRKSDEKPSADETRTVELAPKGAKPGVLVSDTFEITAKVEKIDKKKRNITLKGPEGNIRTFPVDKGVKNFKNIKVGDEVVMRITEAMAIYLEKP